MMKIEEAISALQRVGVQFDADGHRDDLIAFIDALCHADDQRVVLSPPLLRDLRTILGHVRRPGSRMFDRIDSALLRIEGRSRGAA